MGPGDHRELEPCPRKTWVLARGRGPPAGLASPLLSADVDPPASLPTFPCALVFSLRCLPKPNSVFTEVMGTSWPISNPAVSTQRAHEEDSLPTAWPLPRILTQPQQGGQGPTTIRFLEASLSEVSTFILFIYLFYFS